MDLYWTTGALACLLMSLMWFLKSHSRPTSTHELLRYGYRIFLFITIVPVSLIYDAVCYISDNIFSILQQDMSNHENNVEFVQEQVRQWIAGGKTTPMCTARPSWHNLSVLDASYKKKMNKIQVNMKEILSVDVKRRVVHVEPLCTMGQISAALVPLGWSLPVTPEFEELTVGGMVNGFGIETSSHKYGLFQDIVTKMELVMCDGTVKTCSTEDNPDLFHAIPVSHGTLGFLVSVELKMIPVKPYVKLHYYPVKGSTELANKLEEASRNKDNDFVECLMFSLDSWVLMVGKLSSQAEPGKVNHIGRYYKPWFYKHVQGYLAQAGEEAYVYIPLRHYYHRHSKCYFWELSNLIPFGNHPVFRYLLGWTMPIRLSFLKLTYPNKLRKIRNQRHMLQDFLLPVASLEQTLKFFDDKVNIYPIWVCPFNLPHKPGFLHPPTPTSDSLYVDIGLYGRPQPRHTQYDAVKTTREIEAHVCEAGGYQMLYAECFQSKEEFYAMFDHSLYDKVRQVLGCDQAFPLLYDKVNKNARLQMNGLVKGIAVVQFSYFLLRKLWIYLSD